MQCYLNQMFISTLYLDQAKGSKLNPYLYVLCGTYDGRIYRRHPLSLSPFALHIDALEPSESLVHVCNEGFGSIFLVKVLAVGRAVGLRAVEVDVTPTPEVRRKFHSMILGRRPNWLNLKHI